MRNRRNALVERTTRRSLSLKGLNKYTKNNTSLEPIKIFIVGAFTCCRVICKTSVGRLIKRSISKRTGVVRRSSQSFTNTSAAKKLKRARSIVINRTHHVVAIASFSSSCSLRRRKNKNAPSKEKIRLFLASRQYYTKFFVGGRQPIAEPISWALFQISTRAFDCISRLYYVCIESDEAHTFWAVIKWTHPPPCIIFIVFVTRPT